MEIKHLCRISHKFINNKKSMTETYNSLELKIIFYKIMKVKLIIE